MKATRDQQKLADKASADAAQIVTDHVCRHERRCGCFGRFRVSAWLALDAIVNAGWTLTPPVVSE